MSGVWSWIIQHWKALGITISVPSMFGALKWIHGVYKAQRGKRLDARVLETLGDRQLWSSKPRPFLGSGDFCVRAGEISEIFNLPLDAVADSLERLEAQGKARRSSGTMDNPAPYWNIVRR